LSRPNIDETDVKIINILQEDPRTTYLQLAKDCQVSIDSVRRRYERLRKDGIVVSEIISLLPQALGVDCISWLGITTQPGKESEVLESLKAKPEIQANFVEIGKYNIRSILGVKHLNDLAGVVDSIKKIQYINDVDVMIWSDIQSMAYPRNLVIELPSRSCRPRNSGHKVGVT
jgi:DNA-binding Lrp family transcriptional regulator